MKRSRFNGLDAAIESSSEIHDCRLLPPAAAAGRRPPATDSLDSMRTEFPQPPTDPHTPQSLPGMPLVPGYVSTQPVTRYNPWTNTYHTYLRTVLTPDRVESTTVQRFRTDVWSQGELRWSGTLEVSDAPNAGIIDKNVSNHIIPELEEIGLVPKRRS